MPDMINPVQDMKSKAFNRSQEKDNSISVISEQNDIEYLAYLYNDSGISEKYHDDVIRTAKNTIYISVALFVLITLFICVLIIFMLTKTDLTTMERIIPLVSACFVDLLSVTLVSLMNNLLKSKDKYFERSDENVRLSKMIGLAQTIKDEKFKNKMIEKLINNYCSNNNDR